MIFLFALRLFLFEAHADIPVPGPQYAKEELGSPRLPPHVSSDWIWMAPIGTLGVVLAAMFVMRKKQSRANVDD